MSKVQFIKWNDKFSVGNEKLDSQHRKIVELINTLYVAIQEKRSSIINTILSELYKYTNTHFIHEENLMERYNYPDCHVQKRAHLELLQKTSEFIRQKEQFPGDISFDVFQFLKSWWTNHILKMDLKYTSYLECHGKDNLE